MGSSNFEHEYCGVPTILERFVIVILALEGCFLDAKLLQLSSKCPDPSSRSMCQSLVIPTIWNNRKLAHSSLTK